MKKKIAARINQEVREGSVGRLNHQNLTAALRENRETKPLKEKGERWGRGLNTRS